MAAEADAARQAKWQTDKAGNEWSDEEAARLKGYTCSSCGAEIVCDETDLRRYFQNAVSVSNDAPVLLDRFLDDAI
ncbi:MAG: hypothetical protein E7F13_08660, partial [Megasphaera sp.]|nr:hypothetical protein [Megasphaera sp.]